MTLQLDNVRRGSGAKQSARTIAALLSLALLLAGRNDAAPAADGAVMSIPDQLAAFVADFARRALAARLL